MLTILFLSSNVIVPIFFNPEILDVSPKLYAITDKGEKAQEEWVEMANWIKENHLEGLLIHFYCDS